jgi:hypothetical protein
MLKVRNQKFILISIVFILTFSVRAWYISQKEGFCIDESWSVAISLCKEYGLTRLYEEKVYSGKEIKEIIYNDTDTFKEVLKDIQKLWIDTNDPLHASLYYFLLRLWIAASGGHTGDVHSLVIQCCSLNLLFFIIAFFFMYQLVKKFFSNQWIIAFALFVAFFSTGSIANTLYLREYQLQEALFIIMAYMFVFYYQKIEERKKIDTWGNRLLLAIVVCCVLSVGYFGVIPVGMYLILLFLKSYKEKQKENFFFLFCSLILGLIFAGALYCKYYEGLLFSSLSKEAINKTGDFYPVLVDTIYGLGRILNDHLFYTTSIIIIFVTAIYLIFWQKVNLRSIIKSDKVLLLIIFVSSICVFGSMFLAPWRILRFIVASFPLLALLIPWIVSKLTKWKSGLLMATFCLVFFIAAFNPSRIEFLYKGFRQYFIFNQKPEVPVMIESASYFYVDLFSYFSDTQQYEFVQSSEKMLERLNKYDKVLILVEVKRMDPVILNDFKIIEESRCGTYYKGYYLEKNSGSVESISFY